MKRIVIGITGASGAIYGVRTLEALQTKIETHLVITERAKQTIRLETDLSVAYVESLAAFIYQDDDLSSPLASGSFPTEGMIIIPCSIKTLSAVANSFNQSLVARAADVNLKEGRRVALAVRETPFHLGHIRLMERVSEAGGIIVPPLPSFYSKPTSIEELVNHSVGKVLDLFNVSHDLYPRWQGMK